SSCQSLSKIFRDRVGRGLLMREAVGADVSLWWWVRLGADEPRFDKRGYGAGGILVSIVVQIFWV
ncbi:MAG: hypothetical protein KDK99_05780, partial [Verrucomicrobiales bacterium]|nr:hypothetical protein [Verrucomicrobiales bacterium]